MRAHLFVEVEKLSPGAWLSSEIKTRGVSPGSHATVMRRSRRVVALPPTEIGVLKPHAPVAVPSGPVGAVERAIADGLRDVRRADFVCAFEVCDGAADLQDSIIRARRQPLPRHRLFQQTLALVAHRTEASYVSRRHLRVREDALAAQALALPKARANDARANLCGRLARGRFAAQLFEADGGHVNVYVYPVEERAGDATDVALDLQRRAAALARRVVPESARAELRCLFAMCGYRPKSLSLRRTLLF